eukprot:12896344-Prorocentrum_lima.AAC.1
MDKDPNIAALFQRGGYCTYGGASLHGSGVQHILFLSWQILQGAQPSRNTAHFHRVCALHARTRRSH